MADTHPDPPRPGFPPVVDLQAPQGASFTDYDQQHLLTYARMLDAERAGANWHEAAAVILGRDAGHDELAARSCWLSHLARAHWIATTGYRLLLSEAGLPERE